MRITIKLKLALAFAAIILLSVLTAAFGISSLGALNASMIELRQGPVERALLETELYTDLIALSRAERSLILAPTEELARHYQGEIVDSRKAAIARRDRLNTIGSVEGKKKLAIFSATLDTYFAAQDQIRSLARQDKEQATQITFGAGSLAVDAAKAELAGIIDLNKSLMQDAQEKANRDYETERLTFIIIVAVSLLIGTGAGIWISYTISRGLGRAKLLADAVADGDLDQQIVVESNDEIKDMVLSLNRMTANLREAAGIADAIAGGDLTVVAKPQSAKDTLGKALERMLAKLREVVTDAMGASENVSSGSQELSASAEQLSEGATAQGRRRGGGFGVDGGDGGQHQAERR
jgi:methyl-accepting chemotaxis protein